DFDVERGNVQGLDHEAAAERGGEMRVRAELARLDPGAVGVEAQPLDAHDAGEGAVRALERQLAARLALRALERPLQAALGGEEPYQRRDRADEERGDKRACAEEKG